MSETYSKNYFEKYAALTLCHMLNVDKEWIIQSDRPDLRIPHIHYGIEVTQALTPQEAVADMKKPLYALLDLTPFNHSHQDIDFVISKIDNAIERKIIKSKNYEKYENNGLYIFSHCHNLAKEELMNYFQTSHKFIFYRYIYINCVTTVYCFDNLLQKMTSVHFHKTQLLTMNIQALIFEKNCSKKRKKIILS